jgi:hypothetical protein
MIILLDVKMTEIKLHPLVVMSIAGKLQSYYHLHFHHHSAIPCLFTISYPFLRMVCDHWLVDCVVPIDHYTRTKLQFKKDRAFGVLFGQQAGRTVSVSCYCLPSLFWFYFFIVVVLLVGILDL